MGNYIIFLIIYFLLLVISLVLARAKNEHSFSNYRLLNKSVYSTIGFLTFAATLFSTFTLLGLPNFFRVHGIGAWIFLGVTDVALVAFLIFIGQKIRTRVNLSTFSNLSTFLLNRFTTSHAKHVYLFGIFIFLLPYVAIQIRGVISFLQEIVPIGTSLWFWGIIFTAIILIYSFVGGLRAIIYSDIFQSIILLAVTYIIATNCISDSGGIRNMFESINGSNPKLLTSPGPKGLMNSQFLFMSFVTIILMTITQPQLFTRIIIIKSNKEFRKMCFWLGIFALVIITPTIFIGLYGSINYGDVAPNEFWVNVLVKDQNKIVGGLLLIGLVAAAMSTSDSQLFALESEFDSDSKEFNWKNKLSIILFGIISLLLAIISPFQDKLISFATLSFQGTSLLTPLILSSVFFKNPNNLTIYTTLVSILIFCLAIIGIIPAKIFGIYLILILLILLSIQTIISNKDGFYIQ